MFETFAALSYGRWQAGIGDPTVLGWFTAFAYFAAAALCFAAHLRLMPSQARRERVFWFLLGGLMLFLGLNKQLDLQSLFTEIGRDFAQFTGWYGERRYVQAAFIVLLAGLGVAGIYVLWRFVHRLTVEYRLAVIGITFQLCFIVIRAASFHHFDQFLELHLNHVRMNHVLELAGIIIIGLAAFKAWRKERSAFGPSGDAQFSWTRTPNF